MFISYAQNFEDIMLWRALGAQPKGFYIDIGAWLPDRDSVTRAFYERGWHGINVEPNASVFAEIERARPRDVNLRVAVSDAPGRANMHFLNNPGLSTLDASIARKHIADGLVADVQEVKLTTLAELWREYVPDGQEVHFLKVDVEGLETAVLRGNDWEKNRPWVLVVEATYPMSQVETYAEWEPIVQSAGYRLIYADGLNRYYIDPAHEELALAFTYPPNVFDDFRLIREIETEEQRAKLEGQLNAASAQLAATEEQRAKLEGQLNAAPARLAATEESLRAALASRADAVRDLNYLRERKGWESLLFRKNGRPAKALRRALFHASGKPRGIFRSWVLSGNGQPRRPFRQWMTSASYLALPRSVIPATDAGMVGGCEKPVWRTPVDTGIDEAGLDRLMERIRGELLVTKAG
jgi:FkbM family methyltransferase